MSFIRIKPDALLWSWLPKREMLPKDKLHLVSIIPETCVKPRWLLFHSTQSSKLILWAFALYSLQHIPQDRMEMIIKYVNLIHNEERKTYDYVILDY